MSKKKKMKSNTTARVLALLIAIVLWSFVMKEENPEITNRYKDIEVELENLDILIDDGLEILEPRNPKISVEVAGKRSEFENNNRFSMNNISAKVDLTECVEGKNTVPVNIDLVNNVSNVRLIDYEPREIVFVVDRIITEEKEVIIEAEGELEQDFILDNLESNPPMVELTGPKSYINKISQVVATVELDGKTNTFDKSVPLKLLDIEGLPVRGVSKSPNMVNIRVPISKKMNLPVKLKTKGELPDNYKIKNLSIEPETVDIKAKTSSVEIDSINTKPVDLNDLIGKSSYKIELDLPENVELADKDKEYILKYELEEVESANFRFDFSELEKRNLGENLIIDETSKLGVIDIVIRQGNSLVNKEALKPYIDLQNLGAGTHEIKIQIDGISGDLIESISPPTKEIILIEE